MSKGTRTEQSQRLFGFFLDFGKNSEKIEKKEQKFEKNFVTN
jgi:hypothetical protein